MCDAAAAHLRLASAHVHCRTRTCPPPRTCSACCALPRCNRHPLPLLLPAAIAFTASSLQVQQGRHVAQGGAAVREGLRDAAPACASLNAAPIAPLPLTPPQILEYACASDHGQLAMGGGRFRDDAQALLREVRAAPSSSTIAPSPPALIRLLHWSTRTHVVSGSQLLRSQPPPCACRLARPLGGTLAASTTACAMTTCSKSA
jgi:hypothetical protein